MENLSNNDIIGLHQKMNRINFATKKFILSEFGSNPLLVSRDKNNHVLILLKSFDQELLEDIIECRMLCKENNGFLSMPIVGKVNYKTNGRTFKIEEIEVIDEMRNQGIGKLLLEYVEDIAKKEGYSSVISDSLLNRTILNSPINEQNLENGNENLIEFDKNLYLYASLGYGTDWNRDDCVENSIPLKKDNPQNYDLRFGPIDLDLGIYPENENFKITEFHETLNAEGDHHIEFSNQDFLQHYEPLVVLPTEKDLKEYKNILNKETKFGSLAIRNALRKY